MDIEHEPTGDEVFLPFVLHVQFHDSHEAEAFCEILEKLNDMPLNDSQKYIVKDFARHMKQCAKEYHFSSFSLTGYM